MARWAMVQTVDGRVCEIAAEPFEVHSGFQWVDVTDNPMTDAELMNSTYVDGVFHSKEIELVTTLATEDWLARWTNQEYLALEKKRRDDIANNKIGNAKNWDVVTGGGIIDTSRTKYKNLMADLVAGGILTQARSDEISS